jgi:XTP/dITP diphosphohydrolase
MDLLIATGNKGKVREFREMLGGDAFTWKDLSSYPEAREVDETGATFEENARLKASGYARQTGVWALADDSGLVVDALGGKPGVTSARWAEMHNAGKGDADNNRLLLEQLKDVHEEGRTARFMCVLALSDETGRVLLTAQDSVEGRILRTGRGANGFGYDPLFFVPQLGKTAAELDPGEKHAISHRGKALRKLKAMMLEAGMIAKKG